MIVGADGLTHGQRAAAARARQLPAAALPGRNGPQPGDILDGKYLVEGVIGGGAMGVVVAARHVELGHRVAIKCLGEEARRFPDVVQRFHWEAQASLQIRSEHVIRVFDAGRFENGADYIVMELLEGTDLATLMKARAAPLAIDQAVDFILQACEALAEAHALGIVHRDLKPENLFIARRADGTPLVKVIDFGVSRHVEPGAPTGQQMEYELVGSPAYMSPEQVRNSATVDARADVWSLGVILYELVTGSLVYEDTRVGSMLLQICNAPPPSARSRRADVPPGLDAVIMHCLEKDLRRRVQSVAYLSVALLPFASERSRLSVERIVAVGIQSEDGQVRSSSAAPESPPRLRPRQGRQGRLATALLILVVAGALTIAAALLTLII